MCYSNSCHVWFTKAQWQTSSSVKTTMVKDAGSRPPHKGTPGKNDVHYQRRGRWGLLGSNTASAEMDNEPSFSDIWHGILGLLRKSVKGIGAILRRGV